MRCTKSSGESQPCGAGVLNEFEDYPVLVGDVLLTGPAAWDAALHTVNVGKFNLGWASIGICTHAFDEALHHAAYRRLYGMAVTDFPQVRRMFTDANARLVAMKLFARRAAGYFRSASRDDRRYLLFNPVVKMKVGTEGEKVIDPPGPSRSSRARST